MLHPETMISQLKACRDKAYAPYSNYHVGALVVSNTGQIYPGCNIENAAYGLTQCAEAAAIAHMVVAGERSIESLWLLGSGDTLCTPCGACRQRISEFANSNTTVYLCDEFKLVKSVSIDDILPLSFAKSVLL